MGGTSTSSSGRGVVGGATIPVTMLSTPLLFATVALACPQSPESKPSVTPAVPNVKIITVLNDREARAVLAAFKKSTRSKKGRMADKLAAVEALAQGSHPKFVKPLVTVVQKESALTVRRAASQTGRGIPPPRTPPH